MIGYNKAELARLKLDREVSASVSYFRKANFVIIVFLDNHVDIPQQYAQLFMMAEFLLDPTFKFSTAFSFFDNIVRKL
jgi:hypothetical protein